MQVMTSVCHICQSHHHHTQPRVQCFNGRLVECHIVFNYSPSSDIEVLHENDDALHSKMDYIFNAVRRHFIRAGNPYGTNGSLEFKGLHTIQKGVVLFPCWVFRFLLVGIIRFISYPMLYPIHAIARAIGKCPYLKFTQQFVSINLMQMKPLVVTMPTAIGTALLIWVGTR